MSNPPAARHQIPATRKPPMSDWLRALLETKTGGFRGARYDRCKHCGELTAVGLDDDIAAEKVTIDLTPITPLQEALCAIAGRRTYSLEIRNRTKITIHRRDMLALGRPFQEPIAPAHRCGARFPGFLLAPKTARNTEQEPPF